jgi:tetratricopeptide (TPR) repeat protein
MLHRATTLRYRFSLCFAVSVTAAAPYIPGADDEVLERLPEHNDPSLREIKRLRAALDASPKDLSLAVRLARRAIRGLAANGRSAFPGPAQAALAPWWAQDDPPAAVLLLRATIRQSFHDFPGSIADLDRLIARNPTDGQALLTRCTVLAVIGKYDSDGASASVSPGLTIPLVVAGCLAGPMSLSGKAGHAYETLTDALAQAPNADPGLREWALTLAGEIAHRRGDATLSERHFRAALTIDPRDPYVQASLCRSAARSAAPVRRGHAAQGRHPQRQPPVAPRAGRIEHA